MSAHAESDHWHFVTYGLTELFAKQSEVVEISGFGYELTMRVPRAGEGRERLRDRSRLQVGGPITGASDCAMEAVAFVSDPSMPVWTTSPHGSFEFYELVGVTPTELAEMQASSTAEVVGRLAKANPLLITDPNRR